VVWLDALEGHVVRHVPAYQAAKEYRCPQCGNAVAPGQGHVVAWPEERAEDRRHWHTHCWRLVARRGRIA